MDEDINFENFFDKIEVPSGTEKTEAELPYKYLLTRKGFLPKKPLPRKYLIQDVPRVDGPMTAENFFGIRREYALGMASVYNRIPSDRRISLEEALRFVKITRDFGKVKDIYEYTGDIVQFYKSPGEKYESNYFCYVDRNTIVPDKMLTRNNFMDFINSLPAEVKHNITNYSNHGKTTIRKKNIVGLYNEILTYYSRRPASMHVNPLEPYIESVDVMIKLLISHYEDEDGENKMIQALEEYSQHFENRKKILYARLSSKTEKCENIDLDDLRYLAYMNGIQNVNMMNKEQICSRLGVGLTMNTDSIKTYLDSIISNKEIDKLPMLSADEIDYLGLKLNIGKGGWDTRAKIIGQLIKSDKNKLNSLKDKLLSRIKEGWEESRFCDTFKSLPTEDLTTLAMLYEIPDNTEDVICKKLEEIFTKKKQEYSICDTTDPITGKRLTEIGLQRIITFEQDGVVCCFEIQSLNDYVNSNNKINPYTDTRFTPENIAYAKREYSKYLDLLLEKENYVDFSMYIAYALFVMTYLSSKYNDALFVFNTVNFKYGNPVMNYGDPEITKEIHDYILKFVFSNKQKMMIPFNLPGHANMLMFSKTKNGITCERYEPVRYNNQYENRDLRLVDTGLRKLIEKYPIKYLSQDDLGCGEGPQSRARDMYGFCQSYSMMHADKALAEPGLNTKEIMEKYSYTSREIIKYISKVIKFCIEELQLKKEDVNSIIDYDNFSEKEKSDFDDYIQEMLIKRHDIVPEINYNRLMEGADAEFEIKVLTLMTYINECDSIVFDKITDNLRELKATINNSTSNRRDRLMELSDKIDKEFYSRT